MKKQERKEKANKGFSLVELIVVVAIMAVLTVVIAPQYLKYVEKTRLQKDNSAIAEIANAVKIACANEEIITELGTGTSFTFTKDANDNQTFNFAPTGEGTTQTKLMKEIASTVADSYTTSSTTYRNAGNAMKMNITVTGGVVSINVEYWYDTPDDTSSTTKTF